MKTIDQLQFIILNEKGNIIFSDDTLFSVQDLPSTSVFDWSPFVESIFPDLIKKSNQNKIFTFEKVKTIHHFLNGTYDYSFYKNNQSQIVWVISDCSFFYDQMTKEQQIRNQKTIEKELLAFSKKTIPTLNLSNAI